MTTSHVETSNVLGAPACFKTEIAEVIEVLKPVFARDENINRAILFGSQVTGKATIMSDIDIAVVSDNPQRVDRKTLNYVAETFDVECDFVYTTPEALRLAEKELDVNYSIQKEGVTIWARA
jgi:predicted nucleotidyltransferase